MTLEYVTIEDIPANLPCFQSKVALEEAVYVIDYLSYCMQRVSLQNFLEQ